MPLSSLSGLSQMWRHYSMCRLLASCEQWHNLKVGGKKNVGDSSQLSACSEPVVRVIPSIHE